MSKSTSITDTKAEAKHPYVRLVVAYRAGEVTRHEVIESTPALTAGPAELLLELALHVLDGRVTWDEVENLLEAQIAKAGAS